MDIGARGAGRWRRVAGRLFGVAEQQGGTLLDDGQTAMLREALGQDGWDEAVADFAVTTEDEIVRVRHALVAGDSVRRAAHSLKGAALNMGAHRLAMQAARIEKAPVEEARRLADGLASLLDATLRSMRAMPRLPAGHHPG